MNRGASAVKRESAWSPVVRWQFLKLVPITSRQSTILWGACITLTNCTRRRRDVKILLLLLLLSLLLLLLYAYTSMSFTSSGLANNNNNNSTRKRDGSLKISVYMYTAAAKRGWKKSQ